MENHDERLAIFLQTAMKEIGNLKQPAQNKVLDLGCGKGGLVQYLVSDGYDAYGCDVEPHWTDSTTANVDRLKTIDWTPYRLPFDDNTFDAVVSTSVLEHAQNKEEVFAEIYRVLKVGGYSMHLFPAKWYLPVEPHIFVPLLNFVWPQCPRWWLTIWAFLGIRNQFQLDKSWQETIELNTEYCHKGLSYWSNRKYRELSMKIFNNYSAPMDFYIKNAPGGFAKIFRIFPFPQVSGWISGEFRMNFIVLNKQYHQAT